MIMEVCHHFVVNESCHSNIFGDHDPGMNEVGFDEDHRMKLIRYTADNYFTLRLFTYCKRIVKLLLKMENRFHLTELILFQNQQNIINTHSIDRFHFYNLSTSSHFLSAEYIHHPKHGS